MTNRVQSLTELFREGGGRRPVLDHLRSLEALEPLALDEVEAAIHTLVDEAGDEWERHPIEQRIRGGLGVRWVKLHAAALAATPEPARVLGRLRQAVEDDPDTLPLLDGSWRRVVTLASASDREVREEAARLAVRGRIFAVEVVAAMGDLVARATMETEDYDDHLLGEEILAEVADAGPPLAELASVVALVLDSSSPSHQAAAARALGALRDPRWLPAIERHERSIDGDGDSFEVGVTRATMRWARFCLGAGEACLEAAFDDAGEHASYVNRLWRALDGPPVDHRTLSALERAAKRPCFRRLVLESYARIGPDAADSVRRLAASAPPADPEEVFALHHARFRAGLVEEADFVRATAPLLGTAVRAWSQYVALDRRDEEWGSTVRAAIADGQTAAIRALAAHPFVGARFLPDLVAAGNEAAVEVLWGYLPREVFWSALS